MPENQNIEWKSKWNNEYLNIPSETSVDEPTAEDLARIEESKKKGWI